MRAEQRIWKTNDGRLVADGDVDAATLAYAEGDDVQAQDEDKVRALGGETNGEPSGTKRTARGGDKAAKPAEDK